MKPKTLLNRKTILGLAACGILNFAPHGHAETPSIPATPSAYATLSEGLSAAAPGQDFLVIQKNREGAYRYSRTADGAIFEGVQLFGDKAKTHAAQRIAESKVPPPAKGLLSHLWGTVARDWDGRIIPNEVAASKPTLNLLPDPFNPANESGAFEPTRKLNTPATPDPLGGTHAQGLTFTAPNQQLIFSHGGTAAVNGPWATPVGVPLRLRLWAKSLSGKTNYTLGESSSQITLTKDWNEYAVDLELPNQVSLGFGSGVGNSDGIAAIASAAIYDEFAGDELPDLQELLADEKGAHGTMPLKLQGTIRFTPEGAIDNRVMKAGVRVLTGPDLPETPEYTLGIWVSPEQIQDPSYGTAITLGDHLDAAAKYNQGMVSIYSDKNSAIGARGRLRPFPTNNVGKKRTGQYLIGQGWQHLAITVNNGLTTPYINGIPIYEATQVGWKIPRFNIVSMGYYLPGHRRQMANRYLPAQWQGAYIARKALTDEEILQMDQHGRARLRATGITPGSRRAVAFGIGGRDMARPDSWWWHLCENYDLAPRLHGHLEAQNNGGLAKWASPQRLAFLTRQIHAAADSYDQVWCFVPSGGIDESLWMSSGHDFSAYKEQYKNYINTLRAINPKVRIAVATALPRAKKNASLKTEQVRQAWNEDLRARSKDMNIDRLLDIGLGTEQVDADGVITPESRPGGTDMGNWRIALASLPHSRKPETSLTLSGRKGGDLTGLAPDGTFTPADVYRRIVSSEGSAQITSANPSGSQVGLSTLGFIPTKGRGEGEDQQKRDSIVRFPFSKTTLNPNEWSVENDTSYYERGNDPTYPGGRILGDLLAPVVQGIISGSVAKNQGASGAEQGE